MAVLAGLVVGCLAPAAGEAAITVANTNDSGPGSLRQAIEVAPSGETIVVPAGVYVLTTEQLFINKSLTIAGAGASTTTITAHQGSRVFLVSGKGKTVVIRGVTITEGIVEEPSETAQGGGIADFEAALTLENSIVTDNLASANGASGEPGGIAEGGGIYATGPLHLLDVSLTKNVATSTGGRAAGGGIAQGGGLASGPGTALSGVSLDEDAAVADGGHGGGSVAEQEKQSGGISGGGGAFVQSLSAPGLTLVNVAAEGDRASSAGGNGESFGGISEGGALQVTVAGAGSSFSGLTIAGSSALAPGGTGAKSTGGIAHGGGMWLLAEGVPATIVNATIEGDLAGAAGATGIGQGGGAYLGGEAVPISLTNATVDANSVEGPGAMTGGGDLFAVEEVALKASIVSSGAGPAGKENCAGTAHSGGHNLDSRDECSFHHTGDLVGANPLLGLLAPNGGPLQTQALGAGSPAIDAGGSECAPTDARGVARPQGAGCDIGAFELAPPLVSTGAASAVGATTATLGGTASNPGPLLATLQFQYGPTAAHGSVAAAGTLAGGIAGTPFSATVAGLTPGTVYHFQAVATGPEGTAVGTDQTFTTQPLAPALSGLRISPATLRAERGRGASLSRRKGATITYTDSQAATTAMTVQSRATGFRAGRACKAKRPSHVRRPKRCVRWVTRGSFTHADAAGPVKLHFTGRVKGRPLAPGRYRLLAAPVSAAGLRGGTLSSEFRVVR
jgi:hypothetical protein